MARWRVLARHKWVAGAKISESVGGHGSHSRFTATIRGWQNWKIAQGPSSERMLNYVIRRVRWIRDLIDMDNVDVFNLDNDWRLF